jgi:hypothetical protein
VLGGPAHALLLEGLGDIVGAAGEVEVAADAVLAGGAVAEGVVVEGVGGRVQFAAEALVGVVEVNAGASAGSRLGKDVHVLRGLRAREVGEGVVWGRETGSGLLVAAVARQGGVEAKERHYRGIAFML